MSTQGSMWTLALVPILLNVSARAEEASRVPPEIAMCAGIRQSSERLACFDLAVARLESGQATDSAQPVRSAEDLFGIKTSTPKQADSKDDKPQVEAITAKVTSIRQAGDGVILELDNGQTWRQISGSSTLLIKNGDEIKITRGALSSFNLKTPSGRVAKVRRLQ